MSKLGNKIRDERIRVGLSQRELADKLGKSKNVLSHWERGVNQPDVIMIEKMCSIFEITPNELLNWDDSVLFNNDQPKELLGVDIEYIKLARDLKKTDLSPEDIRQILDVVTKHKK